MGFCTEILIRKSLVINTLEHVSKRSPTSGPHPRGNPISTFVRKPSNLTLLVNHYDHNFWTSALDLRSSFWHSISFFYYVKGMFTSILTKLSIFRLGFIQNLRKWLELSQQCEISIILRRKSGVESQLDWAFRVLFIRVRKIGFCSEILLRKSLT